MGGISRVVLYKHGVGHFERVETVNGNAEIRLTFKAGEMNDVLKSLSLVDVGGGTVQSVSYDTSKPVDKLLEEVALNVPAEGGAAALLARIRGVAVQLKVGNKTHEGRVVGLEDIVTPTEQGNLLPATSKRLTLLTQDGSLVNVDLKEVSQLNLLDESVKKDLSYYFETLIHGYKRDAKNLTVYARGQGERKIHIRYVIETPVWKTSYRVLIPEDEKERPFLEGYALVDNTQDEDWKDVSLTLVSGLPISFVHDLYSPRYIRRREVEVQREAVAGPVMTEEAFYDMEGGSAGPASLMGFAGSPVASAAPSPTRALMARASAIPAPPAEAILTREIRAAAKQRAAAETVTQSVGDLFAYGLRHPVTVHRNQSALVPIVADEFEGRRVSLYNEGQRAENPFSAIEFKNTTGLTLEGGPLVVTEGETYAGEAMLDTLKPNDKRIVPYAVDLGVLVESTHDQRYEDVSLVRVTQGSMYMQSARTQTKVYKLKNKDRRAKLVWLEHPIGHEGKLFETPEPDETTHTYYRFLIRLPAGEVTTFRVCERFDHYSVEYLRNLNRQNLEIYVGRRWFSRAQEAALRPIVDIGESHRKLMNKLQETNVQLESITRDQNRLRENLRALGGSADEATLRSRYVKKLDEQESLVEQLEQRSRKLNEQIQERVAELEKAINEVSFEVLLRDRPPEPEPESEADPDRTGKVDLDSLPTLPPEQDSEASEEQSPFAPETEDDSQEEDEGEDS